MKCMGDWEGAIEQQWFRLQSPESEATYNVSKENSLLMEVSKSLLLFDYKMTSAQCV